jgi:transcription initiation factor IIE alpha subunit
MEMKQINLNSKSTINDKSIKRLIDIVHHLEEKLLSVKITNDRLNELMSIVSKTHENILQDLTNIKIFLNEKAIEQEKAELVIIIDYFFLIKIFLFEE